MARYFFCSRSQHSTTFPNVPACLSSRRVKNCTFTDNAQNFIFWAEWEREREKNVLTFWGQAGSQMDFQMLLFIIARRRRKGSLPLFSSVWRIAVSLSLLFAGRGVLLCIAMCSSGSMPWACGAFHWLQRAYGVFQCLPLAACCLLLLFVCLFVCKAADRRERQSEIKRDCEERDRDCVRKTKKKRMISRKQKKEGTQWSCVSLFACMWYDFLGALV